MLSKKGILYLAWIVSLTSTLVSLYFSEILKFVPCVLCWWQRIFMYPIVLILPIGIFIKDKNIWIYVLTLSISGFFVSFYQNLLYFNFLPQIFSSCTVGVSCTARFIQVLGFLDIPQLSLVAFALITTLMLIYRKLK